ncbi:glucokinase [candidate division KSB1 bacterium]|nr:glucokinase [candidate division KSB1 bacterium]
MKPNSQTDPRHILVGDIGGTKTNLDLYSHANGKLVPLYQASYSSESFEALENIIEIFLKEITQPIHGACFGIAGPVLNDACKTSNLPWNVTRTVLQAFLHIPDVFLLNDLEATAYGVLHVEPKDLVILRDGVEDSQGTIAIIAAGTGLGEAFITKAGDGVHVVASEGGHVDFSPRSELEIEFLRFMRRTHHHVSFEKALSGQGISNIYHFLIEYRRASEPQWLTDRMAGDDKNAVITKTALAGEDEICIETLDLFTSFYGAEAGNLALKVKATGGVYICGGIAPKIIDKLKDGRFISAFLDKGRLREMLENIPVHVVMNEKTALLGAAHYAVNQILAIH